MCLAVPVRVVKRLDGDDAIIDAGGVRKQVSLALVLLPPRNEALPGEGGAS